MFPVLQIARLELREDRVATRLGISGNHHVVEVIVSDEDLRVAEVVARIAIVRTIECPKNILGPGLEVGRGSTHHHLTILAIAVVARIIDIVGTILLIGTARAQGSILLVIVGSYRQQLAH